eukprot:gene3860-8786_t
MAPRGELAPREEPAPRGEPGLPVGCRPPGSSDQKGRGAGGRAALPRSAAPPRGSDVSAEDVYRALARMQNANEDLEVMIDDSLAAKEHGSLDLFSGGGHTGGGMTVIGPERAACCRRARRVRMLRLGALPGRRRLCRRRLPGPPALRPGAMRNRTDNVKRKLKMLKILGRSAGKQAAADRAQRQA